MFAGKSFGDALRLHWEWHGGCTSYSKGKLAKKNTTQQPKIPF